jgi:hypothetical protein
VEFFTLLEEYASSFTRFFERFRERGFVPDDETRAQWLSLGDDYFHLELSKSSLMLPITPQALYWGLEKEYPATLSRLRELKTTTTPEFAISSPAGSGERGSAVIDCLNPESLEEPAFTIEVLHRYNTRDLSRGEQIRSQLIPLEENKRYLYTLEHPASDHPAALVLRLVCNARFYAQPFVVEKKLEIP